jgi:predicted N-acetyltransferase YhbS
MGKGAGAISLRPGNPSDVEECARITFEAFSKINQIHGFPPDFDDVELARRLMGMTLSSPNISGVVAELGGRVAGSAFLWDGAIGGIGPVTVDPKAQAGGVGRAMMRRLIALADEKRMPGVRLVQAAFNTRSMSLYTKLGFDVREPLACMNGQPPRVSIEGYSVRAATETDVEPCSDLCRRVHGHDRRGDVMFGIAHGTARVVEHGRGIVAYATDVGFFGHAVALENVALMALIGAAERITGPGMLLPSRNAELFRWCLSHGLRVVQPMTLMSRGLYNEPRGAFWPSILF